MQQIPDSELVINPDGSIYHLNLRPEQIASTIITVGDPGRVEQVSRYFDTIEVQSSKREFVTHTGRLGHHRITVISTGIGPDNIDITLNELDALANIDFDTRTPKKQLTSLKIIRLGTSGGLHLDVPVDSILLSSYGVGLDNLLHFYDREVGLEEGELLEIIRKSYISLPVQPYATQGSKYLLNALGHGLQKGITLTSPGFYAPQGRSLRLEALLSADALDRLSKLQYQNLNITNFEMETAAIYGLSNLLGHQPLSCNVLLANRANKTFSPDPKKAVNKMIEMMLERIEKMLDAELIQQK